MNGFFEDLRHATRRLLAAPGFTLMAVFSLALGIAGNATMFGALNTLLLRPLPLHEPDRVVRMYGSFPQQGGGTWSMSLPNVLDVERSARVFTGLAGFREAGFSVAGDVQPERVPGARVQYDLFDVLGVAPVLGRGFRAEEDRPGSAERVVVIGHGLWQRRFAGSPAAVGATLLLEGERHTVVGVMPRGFRFPFAGEPELWTPLRVDETVWNRASGGLQAVARLAPGVTIEQVSAELRAIGAQLESLHPRENTGLTFIARTLPEDVYGADLRAGLYVLLGAVGVVLLIACLNLASMLLARGLDRERELAIRSAIGGMRTRLVRLLVLESVVLGLAACAAGLLLSQWGTRALAAIAPAGIARLDELTLDGRVLLLTVAVSLASALAVGMIPALRATRPQLASLLREGGRALSASRQKSRLRRTMVASEVALALVLLVGAGLLLRSLANLLAEDPGFQAEGLLTANVSLDRRYDDVSAVARFQAAVLEQIHAVSGISDAGFVHAIPLGGMENYDNFMIEGRPVNSPAEQPNAGTNIVAGDYLKAMGIPLLRGRSIAQTDTRDAPGVVVISTALANRFWPGEDPLGKRLRMGWSGEDEYWRTVIGVVGDVKQADLTQPGRAELYLPYAQLPFNIRDMTLIVRTSLDPASLAGAVQRAVWSVDSNQPVFDIQTMDQRVRARVAYPRLLALLLGTFSAVALGLSALGLYGVVSYWVAQRTREIGIRAALGAASGQIVRLVLSQVIGMVGAGLLVGAIAAFAATRVLRNLLYQVQPLDATTFAAVSGLLLLVGGLAAAVPVRRALRVDPVEALRAD